MNIKNIYKSEKGIGLVETILALGIAIIVITALVSLALFTLRSSQQSKYLLEGSKLANQELEVVRAYRESVPWGTFYASMRSCDTSDCYINVTYGPPTTYSVATGTEDLGVSAVNLNRYIRVTKPDGSALEDATVESVVKVSVTVQWTIGAQQRYAHTYTHISNWQGQ